MKEQNIRKILIGIICVILSMAITLQIRTMESTDSKATQAFVNDELRDKLLEWEDKYKLAAKSLEETTLQLKKAREEGTKYDSVAQEKSAELKRNNMLLGLTDVSGEGVIITASDGQAKGLATDNYSQYLIHEGDLREIVSELSNAGAEAISINDQRIVNSTCIVCAGNIISINGEKVSSPFVIKAIGNQERLYAIDRPGGYLQIMKEYTNVDIKKSDYIEIKKYDGAITQKNVE